MNFREISRVIKDSSDRSKFLLFHPLLVRARSTYFQALRNRRCTPEVDFTREWSWTNANDYRPALLHGGPHSHPLPTSQTVLPRLVVVCLGDLLKTYANPFNDYHNFGLFSPIRVPGFSVGATLFLFDTSYIG